MDESLAVVPPNVSVRHEEPWVLTSDWRADLSVEYVRASCKWTNPMTMVVASSIALLKVSNKISSLQLELRNSSSSLGPYAVTDARGYLSRAQTHP